MKWITHIALAFFVVKVTEIALMIDLLDSYLAYCVVSVFAVLPDLDFLIGIKHRTWTHTIWFTLTALPLAMISPKLALVGWVAILSHLTGDMMTHSGVKLLYPYRETVFYLTPPNWRVRTGSGAEFIILGVLIIGSILISSVSVQTETEKLFSLSRDHIVTASLSTFENGAVHNYDNVKIVWTDGRDEIGFIDRNGKLKIVKKDEILKLKILETVKADKTAVKRYVKIKNLKRAMWKHRIVTGYEDSRIDFEFVGTGWDLYAKLDGDKLKKEGLGDYVIGVEYYEVR